MVARAAFVVAGLTGGLLATAAPAFAIGERGDPGGGLTWVQTVLIFVGIPFGLAIVITFLVLLPSIVRGPRYRPGRPWTAGSVWFGGPSEAPASTTAAELPASTSQGGGASARW